MKYGNFLLLNALMEINHHLRRNRLISTPEKSHIEFSGYPHYLIRKDKSAVAPDIGPEHKNYMSINMELRDI